MITELQDAQLLARIHGGDLIAKETKYHFNGPGQLERSGKYKSQACLTVSQAILYTLKQDTH